MAEVLTDLVVVLLTGVALTVLAGAVAVALVFRGVRRRVRRVRAVVPPRGLLADPGWWRAQYVRQRMWRAVTAAEHAVAHADRVGASVGDLPMLARQLRRTAVEVDAAVQTTGLPGSVAAEVERVVLAARHVRDAATGSVLDLATTAGVALQRDLAAELQALEAGRQRAASLQPR